MKQEHKSFAQVSNDSSSHLNYIIWYEKNNFY